MALLGIDIGTTHCKAGLFHENGSVIQIATRPTVTYYDNEGTPFYQPDEIWRNITDCIKKIMSFSEERVSVIGITSMAETGLLLDLETGKPRTDFIPWFSRCAEEEAILISKEDNPFHRFQKTGLHNSYKYGLAKILLLMKKEKSIANKTVWLSASDYIAYRLTGEVATDYSLAARTFAFRIDQKMWDKQWINHFHIDEQLFPEALPSGTKMGELKSDELHNLGIPLGTPVAVSGHDHVCAALAVGAINPGIVFDSIGTAETLVGTLVAKELTEKDFLAGLSFGCHVVKNRYFWMGGISASGGSIEWFRNQFSDVQLTYDEIIRLSSLAKRGPTGILYYPYLSGSGSPNPDPYAKAAIIGVTSKHQREDMLKAMMEGTGYEMESIRRSAEDITDYPINRMVAVGGGTKNKDWMQIKADITNCHLMIPQIPEATLLGACVTAGIGCGVYKNEEEAVGMIQHLLKASEIEPNNQNHDLYTRYYEDGYMKLQPSLRTFYHQFH
jgi:sugar (pentulose or hexulose) kinase